MMAEIMQRIGEALLNGVCAGMTVAGFAVVSIVGLGIVGFFGNIIGRAEDSHEKDH